MTRWVIAIATAIGLATTTVNAETVIKLGTLAPTGSTYHDILLDLDQEWRQISGGTVSLQIYGGGVTGDESDMIRKMRIGQLHAATLTSGGLPDIDPDFRAFQVPMMFRTIDEYYHVIDTHRATLDKMLGQRGFHALSWADAGWLHFFTRKPMAVPDDLRRQPLFVWAGADRFIEAWRDGGFQPVALPATEIHTALQSRIIDAISAPPIIALANQWFAQVPQMNAMKWVPLMGSLVISEGGWNALPKALRPNLVEAAERAAMKLRAALLADAAEAVAIMKDYGLQVHEATEEEIGIWRAEVKRFFDPMIGPYINADLVRQIEKTLDAYRARK